MQNKKVTVQMETVQRAGDQREKQTVTAPGNFYLKDGSAHLIYEEENGLKTHIRISDELVHIHRFGELSGDLWFVEGEQRDTRYETPYGRMMLTVDIEKLRWDQRLMKLYLRYRILAEDEPVSKNEITINIKEVEE